MSKEGSDQNDSINQALADLQAGMTHAHVVLDAAEARMRAYVAQDQGGDSPQGQR